MDCMSLVHFLYEKIWQQCLSHVQECKVGVLLWRPRGEEELCAGIFSASSTRFSLDLGFSSSLSVTRCSLAIGHSGSLYLADPALYRA
jgi:hypothetical protein